ncbi:MAG: hypothetical protein WBD98_10715 [Acidobacteriaceae bacterium]
MTETDLPDDPTEAVDHDEALDDSPGVADLESETLEGALED